MRKIKLMRFILVIMIIFTISTTISLINIKKANGSTQGAVCQVVTVETGDTLWNIAKKNCINYKDIRKVIYDIKKLNNLQDLNISPGTQIKIPSCYSANLNFNLND